MEGLGWKVWFLLGCFVFTLQSKRSGIQKESHAERAELLADLEGVHILSNELMNSAKEETPVL